MNHRRLLLGTCRRLTAAAGAYLLAANLAVATGEHYRLETQVYVFRHGDFHTVTLPGATTPDAPASAFIPSPATAQFDADTLALNGPDFSWNGGAKPSGRLSQIAIPDLIVGAGQPATLLSSAPLQYLEKRADGTLEVKEIPPASADAPHARLTFAVKPADGSGPMLDLSCDLELATVSGREKVAGVSLPIGKPVLARLARKIEGQVHPDSWTALVVNAPNGSDYSLLLLCKAGVAPPDAAVGAGPMTPAELDRFATHYYEHPQPEQIGRAIEGLGPSGFLVDRKDVFVGFFAGVFAANPERVGAWRKVAGRQDEAVQNVVAAALNLDNPGEVLARKYESVAQNDRCWGAFFATGDAAYLHRLADRMHLVGEADGARFWIGATAMWSLARNAGEHPAVRTTLEAYRPEADRITRGLIGHVLGDKPEKVRTWLMDLWKSRTAVGTQFGPNGMLSGGERDNGYAPIPSQMGPAFARGP